MFAHESDRLRPRFFEGRLSVSPVPLVGQRATVSLELTAISDDCEGATIQFRAPAGVALLGRSIFENQYFPRGLSYRYFTDIEALEEGSYALQATVYFRLSDGRRRAEHFFTYLVAGKTDSQAGGAEIWKHGGPPRRPFALAPPRFAAPIITRSGVGGTVTVSGYITYYDDNMSLEVPIRRIMVELFEKDEHGSQRIDSTYTDNDGFYSFDGVSNVDPEDETGRDIQLRISSENEVLKITDGREILYRFDSFTVHNVSDGQINIDYSLDDRNQHRGLGHIFNCVIDAYDFLQKNVGWHRRKITVRWPYGEWSKYRYKYYLVVGTIYQEYIQVPAGKEWDRTTMLHEYGHSVMTALYGYNVQSLPQDSFQGGHSVYTVSDPGLAMKEGWAEFFEALVDNSAYNVVAYLNADTPNIESNGWWTGDIEGSGSNMQGEIVEGAVASILWDIADTAHSRDGTPGLDDDDMEGMLEEIWDLMLRYRPVNILEFWDYWVENGYGQIPSLYSIYTSHSVEVAPPWDVNEDGTVDSLDLIIIGSYFGQKISIPVQPNPDVNRDGEVNILDLIIWAGNVMP